MNSWPDAGMTPFRNEKNSNLEGAYAYPRWCAGPGHIEPGSLLTGIGQPSRLGCPTLLAAAGEPDMPSKCA